MKLRSIITFLLLAVAFLTASAKDYKYTTVPNDPMQSRIYTLDNGLKVYLSVNKERPRIQTYITVKTGSRNDPAETTGLAHYLEHLMFKGTKVFGTSNYEAEKPYLDEIEQRYEAYRKLTDPEARRKAYHEIDSVSQLAAKYNIPNEYDKMMSSIGAEGSNAYTSNDVTCYTEDIPSNEVDTWARVEADRFKNMVIRGFHTELEAVYEEYNIGLASDGRKEWDAMGKLLFPTHPYGTQSTIGTQEHLKNPSIVNIKNYFRRYYVPNNVAICMAGDFDPDQVIAIIDKYFGDWKASSDLSFPQYAPVRELTQPKDTTVVGLEAENIMLGWKAKGAADYQADTLGVIAEILSNGKAGLFDIDLNTPMKIQGAGAFNEGMHDYGVFILEGMPNQGQSLDDVKQLMLGEIDKLKRGDFSDELLPSVVNNYKLNFYRSLLSNQSRANRFVDAFINDQKWSDAVGALDRVSGMTKQQIVSFANRFFTDGYAVVYKKQGNDTTIHKIDKPQITPIPTNNDKQSEFLKAVVSTKPEPIQPRFVDFKTDLTVSKTKRGLDYLYKQNADDDLFQLAFRFPIGTENNKQYSIAADYLDYVGTDKMTNEQINQQFYKLACNYSVRVNDTYTDITLTGLNANMPAALQLMEDVINGAKADQDSYKKFVDLVVKNRNDNKTNQRANFAALTTLGEYGTWSRQYNIMSEKELREANPQALLDLVKGLKNYQHTLLYFGPTDMKKLETIVAKAHKTPKAFAQVPVAKPYLKQQTPTNEVWIAPYEAKNIYMTMYHNEGSKWSPDKTAVEALFNDYFGGGMNAIVFQELREARGLAYSASARYQYMSSHPKEDTECFTTTIISQNDKMMDCISEFHNLLNNTPERQAGFELAKQGLTKSLATARTTRANVLYAYLQAKRLGIDYDLNGKVYEQLPSVTLKDIMDFAHSNIANKTYRYLILGDEKNLDMKALEKIGPIRHLTTEEIFSY